MNKFEFEIEEVAPMKGTSKSKKVQQRLRITDSFSEEGEQLVPLAPKISLEKINEET